VSIERYNCTSRRIRERIYALDERRPANIRPQLWADSVGWAGIAQGNICFSEEHTTYEAMCRLEEQLDEKLKGKIDLGTLEWIWDRLAETGPHGQSYVSTFRKAWKELIQAEADREEQPQGK
jgi:hypothetical protein